MKSRTARSSWIGQYYFYCTTPASHQAGKIQEQSPIHIFTRIVNGLQVGSIYSLLLIFIMLFRTEGLMGTKESRIIKIEEAE